MCNKFWMLHRIEHNTNHFIMLVYVYSQWRNMQYHAYVKSPILHELL